MVNSLIISILQYPCSCTFSPQRVFTEFKTTVTDFIWNSGKSKIAYNVLIQDICDGGLKLQDLQTRVQTIHLQRLKDIWTCPQSIWSEHVQGSVDIRNHTLLLLSKINLVKHFQPRQIFLKQIFKTWTKYHNLPPTDEDAIKKEVLWYNPSILIDRVPAFWSQWNAVGITTINDLLHPLEPRFLSHEELSQVYGCRATFLQILQVRSAIPFTWRRKIASSATENMNLKPSITTPCISIDITKSTAKKIYSALVETRKPSPISSQRKWNEFFPVGEDTQQEYWDEVYASPYKAARDTKLQAFQYRVVHRILACNKFLSNIRVRTTDTCSFCPQPDMLQHFLVECPQTKTFWDNVSKWFDKEGDVQLNLSVRARLFGVPASHQQSTLINFLMLFVKFHIFRQKLFHQGSLSMVHLLRDLRTRLNVEQYLTILTNRSHKFDKWRRIHNTLG